MLKINYQDLGQAPDFKKYQKELDFIKKSPAPAFETEKPDLKLIQKSLTKYKKYKNIILIANGGSRTSARAFYYGLSDFRNKVNLKFATSCEPRVINDLRKKYSKRDTLVLVISKSGDNINNIEPLLLLLDYKVLVITGAQKSALREMAEKKKWDIVLHPEVGGRFSGMTSCGLAPAYLMGLDAGKIYAGAKNGYEKYSFKASAENNDALKLALYFSELGKKGYSEIFASLYSSSLVALLPLLTQLIHETYGKNGMGQTIFGDYSPESQHHTNQRFFGGPRNVIGLFLSEEKTKNDLKIKVPSNLSKIPFRDIMLGKLNNTSTSLAMKHDMQGVMEKARNEKIPFAGISVDEAKPESIGELVVFFQYFAVYSAMLRHLNPFDQPEVEEAKKISLKLRLNK